MQGEKTLIWENGNWVWKVAVQWCNEVGEPGHKPQVSTLGEVQKEQQRHCGRHHLMPLFQQHVPVCGPRSGDTCFSEGARALFPTLSLCWDLGGGHSAALSILSGPL